MELFKIFGTVGLKGVDQANDDIKDITDNAEKSTSKLGKIGGVLAGIGKGVLAITTAVGGATIGLVKKVSSAYGELQQSIGGVETLFGESANKVIENANNAFKTAGVSANDYMQQVTSFTASLLNSLDGDTSKAADIADMAIRDMADNANKMGTSMEMIQNAYQGFSRQQYIMLDNLKLGYGGTKTEMERLLKDAEKISGIKYDISNLDDVFSAIHVIQQELGITGTTAIEADKTITGSFNSLSSAWQNFLAGLGNPEADMKQLVDNVAMGISGAVNNVTPVINNMVTVLPTVADALISTASEMLPQFIDTFTELVTKVLDAVVQVLPNIIPPVIDCVLSVADAIIANLPLIVTAGMQLILGLAQGISEMLPELMPTIVNIVVEIVNILLSNLPLLIDVAMQLALGLAKGLVMAIPQLVDSIPVIMENIIIAVMNSLPLFLESGFELIMEMGVGILKATPNILSIVKNVFVAIFNGLAKSVPDGFAKIIDGIKNLWSKFTNWLSKNFKLPHFSISGSWNPADWINGKLPRVNVEWYAKGGIMTEPTLFGVNPATGNAMVGGESGAEAIAPISTLQQYVSNAVKEETSELAYNFSRMYELLVAYLPIIIDNMDRPIVLDNGAIVSGTVDKMDNALGLKANRKSRYGV